MSIHDALRQKFSEPEWLCAFEATLDERRADFIAANMWKSRGYSTVAVEIKVSRQDWLRELKNPAKQETISKYVDHIYLAVPDAKIVGPGELPSGWGLFVLQGSRLVRKVAPADLKSNSPREFYTRMIQKLILERAKDVETMAASRLEEKVQQACASSNRTIESLQWELENLRNKEVTLDRIAHELAARREDPERVRKALRILDLLGDGRFHRDALTGLLEFTAQAVERVGSAITEIHALSDALQLPTRNEGDDQTPINPTGESDAH